MRLERTFEEAGQVMNMSPGITIGKNDTMVEVRKK